MISVRRTGAVLASFYLNLVTDTSAAASASDSTVNRSWYVVLSLKAFGTNESTDLHVFAVL